MTVEEIQKKNRERIMWSNLHRIKYEIYDRLIRAPILKDYTCLKDVSPMQLIDSSCKINGRSYNKDNTLMYHKCDYPVNPPGITNISPQDYLIGIYFDYIDNYSISNDGIENFKTILCDYGTPYILRIGVWEGKIFTQLSTGGLGTRGDGKGIYSQYSIYIPEDMSGPLSDALLFRIGKLTDEIYYEIQSLLMQINK